MPSTLPQPLHEVYDNVLSENFCKNVIDKFESDNRTIPGITQGGYMPNEKDSQDLNITDLGDWKEIDDVFYNALMAHLPKFIVSCSAPVSTDFDQGFQIQRTTPEQIGYKWHHDFCILPQDNNSFAYRLVTYIFYLNDVSDGGETEFWDTTKIKPKTGRLLLFSSDVYHVHRGCRPISNTKYICTGWAYKIF